jgi:PAS domain-containing protein
MASQSLWEVEVQDKKGRWYSLRIRPYYTTDNRIDGAVLVLVDVDALKRVEVAIRASETRFQLLADTAPVLIWVHDLNGCQLVNRAYLEFLSKPRWTATAGSPSSTPTTGRSTWRSIGMPWRGVPPSRSRPGSAGATGCTAG